MCMMCVVSECDVYDVYIVCDVWVAGVMCVWWVSDVYVCCEHVVVGMRVLCMMYVGCVVSDVFDTCAICDICVM